MINGFFCQVPLDQILYIADVDLQHLNRGKDSSGVPVDGWDCGRESFQFFCCLLNGFDSCVYLSYFSSGHRRLLIVKFEIRVSGYQEVNIRLSDYQVTQKILPDALASDTLHPDLLIS